MTPMSVVDYIAVHELAHIKYFNLFKIFLGLVETIIADYEEKQE
ncbi:M48 family metallopeptidase [Fuchsiella alkaliacetigena]|nr:M48 family metallopeptidase [Fuchsiella alkaliacetigena]